MNSDLISRNDVLKHLIDERDKLISSIDKKDTIPFEAKQGALLTIKTMMNFITQVKSVCDDNNE